MLSRQIALYSTENVAAASTAAMITFVLSAYFSSLSLKFDSLLIENFKVVDKVGILSFLACIFTLIAVTLTPLKILWQGTSSVTVLGFWHIFAAVLLSFLPMAMLEAIKIYKKNESALERDS